MIISKFLNYLNGTAGMSDVLVHGNDSSSSSSNGNRKGAAPSVQYVRCHYQHGFRFKINLNMKMYLHALSSCVSFFSLPHVSSQTTVLVQFRNKIDENVSRKKPHSMSLFCRLDNGCRLDLVVFDAFTHAVTDVLTKFTTNLHATVNEKKCFTLTTFPSVASMALRETSCRSPSIP